MLVFVDNAVTKVVLPTSAVKERVILHIVTFIHILSARCTHGTSVHVVVVQLLCGAYVKRKHQSLLIVILQRSRHSGS